MKLKEYIENLQKIADKHPNSDVVYSKDDEGNEYYKACHTPSLGYYSETDRCFFPLKDMLNDLEDMEVVEEIELIYKSINAVCIN
jgi:hypothetical protein